jgi:hypothetical protein
MGFSHKSGWDKAEDVFMWVFLSGAMLLLAYFAVVSFHTLWCK